MELRTDIAAALARAEGPARLTVVRAGGLGDSILTLPALQLVRQMVPQVQLTLVGSVWAERLRPLVGFPLRLVRFDSSALTPLFGAPPTGDAPPAGDPSGAFAAAHAVLLYSSDPQDALVQNARRLCPGPALAWPVDPPAGVHAAAHFAGALVAGRPDEVPPPELRVPPELRAWARRRLDEAVGSGVRPVALHCGSGGRRKCWPAEEFAQLVLGLRRPVVLLRGPADEAACAALLALLPSGARPVELAGLEVAQAGAVLAECGLYVGNDSGLTHLAAGLGAPTVAVFGPTDPAVWRPMGPRVHVVRSAGGRAWPRAEEVLPLCRPDGPPVG